MADSLSSPTPSRTDTFDSSEGTPLPASTAIPQAILGPLAVVLFFVAAIFGWVWYKRHRRQRTRTNNIPLDTMGNRREGSDRSSSEGQPSEFGVAATEPVGPLDTGANENPVGPIFATPSDIAVPDVAPNNEPLRPEVEDSQVGADVEGPPVGPTESHASETPVGPINPTPSEVAAQDVDPDNNPLREPQATFGSWHDQNLGNL